MLLNFLILKLLASSTNIIPVLLSPDLSVKLEGDRKTDSMQRNYCVSVVATADKFCTSYLAWKRAKSLQITD